MKKLLAIMLSFIIILSLIGCSSEPVKVNVSNSESLSSNQFGEFVNIGDNLYYDSATRIVYMKNYSYMGYCFYTTYYAPNGLPYRYNSQTNTFEEIN